MSDSYLEGEEETLGSCTHALYALEEPHSSGSEMTSCFCNKHMSCVHTKRSRLERKGHGDGELCSDVWQFLIIKIVYICLFIFFSLQVCKSLDVVSCVDVIIQMYRGTRRLKNVGLDHPYITHFAVPLFRLLVAGFCQWRAERSSRKFGWSMWHWGKLFLSPFQSFISISFHQSSMSLPERWNFTET